MVITVADIRAHEPCYDPTKYVAEDWSGTLLDVLNLEAVPAEDRLWVVAKFLDDKMIRLLAIRCAREALKRIDNPDPRSLAACDVAERFANGNATAEELKTAREAAWYATIAAKSAAAWTAAREAAIAAYWVVDIYAIFGAHIEKLKEMLREGA